MSGPKATAPRTARPPLESQALSPTHQVFVSYAHADDEPLDDGVPGWASFFVDKLKRSAARQPGGAGIEFWMDHRLEPHRRVDDELRKRLRESAVILALLSPRYMESDWCRQEMATFVEEVGGGVSADRVFLVEALPTERPVWHPAIRDLTPVQFWASGLTNPEPMTLGWPLPDVRGDREYWKEINRLASILARQLRTLPEATPPVAATPPVSAAANGASPGQPSPPAQRTVPAFAAQPAPPAQPTLPDAPLTILINADAPDQSLALGTQAVLDELDADGYLAPVMAAGQNPGEFRIRFEERLKASHGVIVVYGEAPPTWVQAQYGDVRKVLALHRKGTWAGLMEGPPQAKAPHGLPPRGLMVLDCKQGLNKAELSRFVDALKAAAAQAAVGNGA